MVMVYAGTINVEKYSIVVLEEKFRLLGRNLKAKTSEFAFSEMLPFPYTGPARQA